MDALGGVVPSWRALTHNYSYELAIASTNKNPPGVTGEAWRIFEDLVADGMEFCFGRKVRRLGARKRGVRVSDMLAQIPEGPILVVDAKACANGFDCTFPSLRPLIEYTKNQRIRQRGQAELYSAILVSSSFKQPESRLNEVANAFRAETSIGLALLTAEVLGQMVSDLSKHPTLRNALSWRPILTGSPIKIDSFRTELERSETERIKG